MRTSGSRDLSGKTQGEKPPARYTHVLRCAYGWVSVSRGATSAIAFQVLRSAQPGERAEVEIWRGK